MVGEAMSVLPRAWGEQIRRMRFDGEASELDGLAA